MLNGPTTAYSKSIHLSTRLSIWDIRPTKRSTIASGSHNVVADGLLVKLFRHDAIEQIHRRAHIGSPETNSILEEGRRFRGRFGRGANRDFNDGAVRDLPAKRFDGAVLAIVLFKENGAARIGG